MEPLYCVAPMSVVRLTAELSLILLPLCRRTYVLPRQFVECLQSCTSFSRWEEHFTRLGSCEASRQVLVRLSPLTESGLLISSQYLRKVFADRPKGRDWSSATISSIVIPTCDRPILLGNVLKSVADNLGIFGHAPAIIVSDDSHFRENGKKNREILQFAQKEYGLSVRYIGEREKKQGINRLIKEGIATDVVNFGLGCSHTGESSFGANRNWLLLETVGELALSTDDDTEWLTGTMCPTIQRDVLCLVADSKPAFYMACGQGTTAHGEGYSLLCDVLKEHQEVLGVSLDCLLAAQLDKAHLLSIRDHGALQQLLTARCKVVVCTAGVIGKSGKRDSFSALYRQRDWNLIGVPVSEAMCRNAIQSDEVIRHCLWPIVSRSGPLLGVSFSFDNRECLPPFFPFGRNEDGVWGELISLIDDRTYFAHLPWAIRHSQGDQTCGYNANSSIRPQLADVVSICMGAYRKSESRNSSAKESLSLLGRHLLEFEEMSPTAFEDFFREANWKRQSKRMQEYERLSREGENEMPHFWRETVRQRLNALLELANNSDVWWPADYDSIRDMADRTVAIKKSISKFGRLIQNWSDIREIANHWRTKSQTQGSVANP